MRHPWDTRIPELLFRGNLATGGCGCAILTQDSGSWGDCHLLQRSWQSMLLLFAVKLATAGSIKLRSHAAVMTRVLLLVCLARVSMVLTVCAADVATNGGQRQMQGESRLMGA